LSALAFMVAAYAFKIRWILKHTPGKEMTPPRGDHGKAIRYAYMTLAMPWELESLKKHPVRYAEFVLFHLGVAAGIGAAFVMDIWPALISQALVMKAAQAFLGLALLAGVSRMIRRMASPAMRAISSPDDYFANVTLNVWLLSAIFAVGQYSEACIFAFYAITSFFLVYVPFSKISHYIYWPFVRYYVGKHFGHRGVYPKKAAVSEQ